MLLADPPAPHLPPVEAALITGRGLFLYFTPLSLRLPLAPSRAGVCEVEDPTRGQGHINKTHLRQNGIA